MQPSKHVPNITGGVMSMQLYGAGSTTRPSHSEGINEEAHQCSSAAAGEFLYHILEQQLTSLKCEISTKILSIINSKHTMI